MKLASLKNNTRDGQLVLVKRDLSEYYDLSSKIPNMAFLMDNWSQYEAELQALSSDLNDGKLASSGAFKAVDCMSPLPRARTWLDGSAYVNHVELVRKARNAEMPEEFWTDPLMYQGASDDFIGPCDDVECISEEHGIDFEAEITVITDDVPMGATPEQAQSHIKLFMLVNDVSLRGLIPNELRKGFGFIHGKPACSFSPVAITPDELEGHLKDNKVCLPLMSYLNGKEFGRPDAGVDMTFDFAQLITHAVKTRNLCAGSVVGSGTVSNLDRSKGSSCIAERRMLEKINNGQVDTAFMKFGDSVKIEMLNEKGENLFGTINQKVVPYKEK